MKFSDTILLNKEGFLLLKGLLYLNNFLFQKINRNFLGGKKNYLLLRMLF